MAFFASQRIIVVYLTARCLKLELALEPKPKPIGICSWDNLQLCDVRIRNASLPMNIGEGAYLKPLQTTTDDYNLNSLELSGAQIYLAELLGQLSQLRVHWRRVEPRASWQSAN